MLAVDIGWSGEQSPAERIAAVEAGLGVCLTLHDVGGLMSPARRAELIPGRNWHPSPYCRVGRFRDPERQKLCLRDCMRECHQRIRRDPTPFVKRCWKGAWELVVPINRHGAPLLLIYAGVFRDPERDEPDCELELGAFHRKCYAGLPPYTEIVQRGLPTVLELLGNSILDDIQSTVGKETRPDDRDEVVRGFIVGHAHQPVSLIDLSRLLHLSPSRTSHIAREVLGKSFQEALMDERMIRARNLLRSHYSDSIADVAHSLGFSDVHYFSRVFSRVHGMGPDAFRRDAQNGGA